MTFKKTDRQREAIEMIAGDATNCGLFGGSGSGKTFIALYALCIFIAALFSISNFW